MDTHIHASGSRRQASWYPHYDGYIAGLNRVADNPSSSVHPTANERSLDARTVRARAMLTDTSPRTIAAHGFTGQHHSHFPRSANGGVMLPSLSETRLLSRPMMEVSTNYESPGTASSTSSVPLPRLLGPEFNHGDESRLAVQNAPANPPAPNTALDTMTSSSGTPQARVVSNDSLTWRQAGFTDVYQFPERRWRRVYDRSFANFPNELEDDVQYQQGAHSLAQSERPVAVSPHNASTRPVQHHPRRRNPGLSQASMSSSSPGPLAGSEHGLDSCRLAMLTRDLQKKIQCALFHSEYEIKRPFPAANIESLEDRSCSICYNDYGVCSPEGVVEEPIKLPGCGHVFGSHCLGVWLRSKTNWKCPMCRAKINPRVDNHYDINLWLEYQRVKDTLENRQNLAFLHRIVASKERPPPPVQGLVVEPRNTRRRPAPDSSRESQQRRVRFRYSEYSEPQETSYGRGRSEAPQAATPGVDRLASASTSRWAPMNSNQEDHFVQNLREHLRGQRDLPPIAGSSESSWAVPASSFPGYNYLEPSLAPSFVSADLPNPLRPGNRSGQSDNSEGVAVSNPFEPSLPYLGLVEDDGASAFLRSETSSEDEQ